jgi:hypothetical protein
LLAHSALQFRIFQALEIRRSDKAPYP